jgi:hypothetical protein
MLRSLDLTKFKLHNVSENGGKYTFPQGGSISCDFGDVELTAGSYLVIDLTNETDASMGVIIGFYENADSGWGDIWFKFGVLPRLKTRYSLPISAMDGSILFLERTPGRLKSVTGGRPVNIANIRKFMFTVSTPIESPSIVIHDIYITDTAPDFPVEAKTMVDSLGQKKITSWQGKTESEAQLVSFLNAEYARVSGSASADFQGRSAYGGCLQYKFNNPKGFFSVDNDGRRWWLVDPDGYGFFSTGLDCVTIDGDVNLNGITQLCEELPDPSNPGWKNYDSKVFSFHASNLYKAFGSDYFEKWTAITARRMTEWGFNTVACWSDMNFVRAANKPYVFILGGYPHSDKMIFRDFPDVFSDSFKVNAEKWAGRLNTVREDKNLIGYFMSNEPAWAFVNNVNPAALLLKCGDGYASKARLIEYLADKYGDIAQLNAAWNADYADFNALNTPKDTAAFSAAANDDLTEFSFIMVEQYIKVPALAARSVDGNHLNLGIRYAWLSSKILAAGSEYTDVYSFNCYSMNPHDSIKHTLEVIGDKPVMIGEFHFGALDRGLDATGLRGTTSQYERGVAFNYYMNVAAVHPNCVGAHYFTLNDQGYLGRFDGENYQIGLVDVCQRPYDEFIDGVVRTNTDIYKLVSGTDFEPLIAMRRANEIPAIAY